MLGDPDDEWEYIPVETAEEVNSCGDMIECNQLKNWNKWLKIRKEQHRYLGLMVFRSTDSLLMNKSDKFRSKVECQWMIDLALKLKINNEYKSDFPYSISKEINKFTNVYTPDLIQKEKGLSNIKIKLDYCTDFENNKFNKLSKELHTLKSLLPVNSSHSTGKLAISGENIYNKPKYSYRGIIPSIYVSMQKNDECDGNTLVAIRINHFIVKSMNKTSQFETCKLYTKSKPINTVKVNEDFWDEIIIENCGQINIQYKWRLNEHITTKYDSIFKEQPLGSFYFDTRKNILGPGQVIRLKVLFRPNKIGPHSENWFVQVEILGRLDPIAGINISLQGIAVPNISTSTKKIPEIILSEKIKIVCGKLAGAIVDKVFPSIRTERSTMDQYHYHGRKMDRLYSAMHITNEGPATIDDLMYRCTRLGRSLQDKYSELVGRTAVTLLKREMVCGHGVQMTRSELNAHKVMFVALNLVDLTLNAYESDYNEACQELLQKKSSISMKKKGSIFLENEESINTTVDMQDQSKECAIIREDWIEMTKPMIYKHLEWAVDRILDYNVRWTECQHRIDDETINNKHAQDSDRV